MAELRGKGWRVLGYFIWMLGAGVVLDSEALTAGGAAPGGRARRSSRSAPRRRLRGRERRVNSRWLRIGVSVALSAVFLGLAVRGVHWEEARRRCAARTTCRWC